MDPKPFWIAAVALALTACGSGAAEFGPVATFDADAAQVIYGMNMKLSKGGRLQADLHADTALTRPGSDVTELKGVDLTFFGDEGDRPGHLSAESGEYTPATNRMVARGDVVLVLPDENGGTRTIRTEELHYDQQNDRVWSTVETSIERADGTMFTQSFEADTRFTNVSGTNARTTGMKVNAGGEQL